MHDDGVLETFERFSADYDARFPKIIPCYAEFHGVVVQRMAEHAGLGPGSLVLELGCGTGELSRRLFTALPHVRLHCIDLSPAMIERARAKLAPWSQHISFAVGNFLSTPMPVGTSGVVSCLAVHHLEGPEKRTLFARLFDSLAPGGIFVLADAITAGSHSYDEYYLRRWVDHMRTSGMEEAEIASVLDDHERNDRFSSLDEQMGWMREAGFERVECLWKHFLLAVMVGEKEPVGERGPRRA